MRYIYIYIHIYTGVLHGISICYNIYYKYWYIFIIINNILDCIRREINSFIASANIYIYIYIDICEYIICTFVDFHAPVAAAVAAQALEV